MNKRKAIETTERVVTKKSTSTQLSSREEQVVRMRHGLRAPTHLALADKAGDNAALRSELFDMEREIMAKVGAKMNPTKRKIVSALRQKKR